MTDDKIKTIRVLQFTGKEEDWNRWSKTFMATAAVKGYKVAPSEDTKTGVAENLNKNEGLA